MPWKKVGMLCSNGNQSGWSAIVTTYLTTIAAK
jgi:hypothetical protein